MNTVVRNILNQIGLYKTCNYIDIQGIALINTDDIEIKQTYEDTLYLNKFKTIKQKNTYL